MTRKFIINGACLISVKGPAGSAIAEKTDLGLTDRDGIVRVIPRFNHDDMRTDGYGKQGTPDVMFDSMDAIVRMTLVHLDWDVLNVLISLSAAGSLFSGDGGLAGAGTPLGKGLPLYDADNSLFSLYLSSPVLNDPWKLYACFLQQPTPEIPLGVKRSLVRCEFRSIPYKPLATSSSGGESLGLGTTTPDELTMSGATLYDASTD